MVQWHLRSKRSPTGKLLQRFRKKRRMDRGSDATLTKIGEQKIKITRCRGGNKKNRVISTTKINVADPKTKTIKCVKILTVVKNPANPHYTRMNIITKGAIVKTELGLAKVTSRPGQDGVVNGVLVEESVTS